MRNCLNNFTTTDIQILENGLESIRKEQEKFSNELFRCLLKDYPRLNPWLLRVSPEDFGEYLVKSLESIIREFRIYAEMITPPKNFGPELSGSPVAHIEHSDMIMMAETFLYLLAELHGEGWGAAQEYSWRKGVNSVLTELHKPAQDFSHFSSISPSTTFLLKTGKERTKTRPRILGFGPMVVIASTITALGLWMPCLSAQAKSKIKNSLQFT